ncbi:hypothetical protein C8J56DRAFT_306900 [Mycena floridula]|nr:hypothetical protein C8J56DRAFT_306900 [Mycena floridula]
MIAALAKAITLYLTPVLALAAIVLSLLAFAAPVLVLHDQVSLLSVTPTSGDGPSVFLGALGSCSRSANDAVINCTAPTISPIYDLSVLPVKAPQLLLSAPTPSTPVFMALAISLTIVFFFLFLLTTFSHKMGAKMAATFDRPMFHRATSWIGFLGFFIGITAFLVVRMWFGKSVTDFNSTVQFMGNGPELVANLGNAFTMVWVAYAFYAMPLIVSMSKMNLSTKP